MELKSVLNGVTEKNFSFITMDSLMGELKVSYSTMRRMMLEDYHIIKEVRRFISILTKFKIGLIRNIRLSNYEETSEGMDRE